MNSFDNFLRAIDIENGTEIWRVKLGNYGMSIPASLHRKILYQPTRGGVLFAVSVDGDVLWKFTRNDPFGANTVHDGRIFQPSEDQNLYCLDLKGKLLWKFKTYEMTWGKSKILGNRVYFGSYDCNLYCVDYERGNLIWKFRAEGSPSYVPPPHETFELQVNKEMTGDTGIGTEKEGRYDIKGESEFTEVSYSMDSAYRTTSAYRRKGSYGEEELS